MRRLALALIPLFGCSDDGGGSTGGSAGGSDGSDGCVEDCGTTGGAGTDGGGTADPGSTGGGTGGGLTNGSSAGTGGGSSDGSTGSGTDSAGEVDCETDPSATCAPDLTLWSAQDLAAAVDGDEVVVVDMRASTAHAAARVPGSLQVQVSDLRATVDGVGGQIAPVETVEMVLSAAGLTPDANVVAYGDNRGLDAARFLWTLQVYGHSGELGMLDGAWDAWVAGDHPTATDMPTVTPADYGVAETREFLRVDADWVQAHLEDASVHLVDARGQGEYDGGHIPGALSVDWQRNLGSDNLFLAREEVAALYADIPVDHTVVTYCQTGSRASVAYFALQWLGYEDVRLYDGSWSEWGSDPNRPQEP